MTKESFIMIYCEESGISKEELLKTQIVLPCNCDYKGCKGWVVISNDELSVKAYNGLNKPGKSHKITKNRRKSTEIE